MFKRNLISSQYLKSGQIPITVIQVKDPANFVVKECLSTLASLEFVKFTEAEEMMQKYYESVEPSFVQLPLKNAIVVVLVDRKFFRAQVHSILNTSSGYIFKVYLLDYGKECNVSRSCLYEIIPDFLMHPFQAVNFKLIDIEPISLVMNSQDMTLSYGSVELYDSSAISYIEQLQRALDQAYIVVEGVENDSLVGSLYMTFCDGEVKCINDELIAKKFAQKNPVGMEKVIKPEMYLRNQSCMSTLNVRQSCDSSSESLHSACSIDSIKNLKVDEACKTLQILKEIGKNPYKEQCLTSNKAVINLNSRNVCNNGDQVRRKMTRCMAVDVQEISREECTAKPLPNEAPNTTPRLQKLMKYRQIKSSGKTEKLDTCHFIPEENNSLSELKDKTALFPPVKNSSEISVSDRICSSPNKQLQSLLSLQVSHVNQKSETQFLGKAKFDVEKERLHSSSVAEQDILKEETQISSANVSPSQNRTPDKLEVIKKFLSSRNKSISPNTKLLSKYVTVPITNELIKKNDCEEALHLNKTIQKSPDMIEDLIRDVMADADDPDDLLQCALDPEKKRGSSSEPETNSTSEPSSLLKNESETSLSLDFSDKSLWEKQKVPALSIGEAIPHPVLSVDETSFTPAVKMVLKNIRFYGPSCIQSVVWPAMNRSRNLAAIAPPHSGKTISYLLPLVSNLTGGTFYGGIPKGKGPIAIILCSSWKKVQAVYDYFRIFGGTSKIKILTLFADGKSKKCKATALAHGCDIIVSVPFCINELFKGKAVDVSRCCHFILDDGNTLLSRQMNEVSEIMLSFVEGIRSRAALSVPLQILICAERWTKSIFSFVDKFMNSPILLFTSFLESTIYAHIPIMGYLCLQNRNEKLLVITK